MDIKIKLTQSLKLFSVLLFCVFFINMASALDFDNVKSYDPVTREVTITNFFGLGADIGKARLNTPLIVDVPTGYQKVAEFDLWAYIDHNDILKSIDLYNKNYFDWEENKFERNIDIKYKSFEDVEVDDFELICEVNTTGSNNSMICNNEKIGSHIEEQEVWQKVTPATLKKNEFVTVGLFTNVEYGDHVEWIPSIYGVEVEEWAEWTSSLNTDLRSYYKLDEASGTVIDALGNYNGTNNGAIPNVTGKINTAYDFEADDTDKIQVTNGAFSTAQNYTWAVWVKLESNPSQKWMSGSKENQNGLSMKPNAPTCYHTLNGGGAGECVGSITVNLETWYHQVCTYDGTTLRVYFDGVNLANCTRTIKTGGAIDNDHIGSWSGGTASIDGELDELGYWIRALSTDEVANLYNNGDGVGLNETGDQAPIITLNSPLTNVTYNTLQTVIFNFTASDDIKLSDVKIYINDALNKTNATGLNNTNYLFSLGLRDGEHLIYGKATDNESQEAVTQTINITIDTTPFIEFLTPPTLVDYANITQEYVPIKVNVSTIYFFNLSYYIENENGTSYSQYFENTTYDINFTDLPDAHYHYNVTICTTTNKCNSTATRHINHDATPPVLSTLNNFTDFLTQNLPINSTWNYTASDEVIDKCYYNTSEDATFNVITCNASTITEWATNGNKSIQFCANDTFGNEQCYTESIWVVEYSQTDNPDPSSEGFDATFTLVLNATNIPTTTAIFNINGTTYTPTIITTSNAYIFTKVLNIPNNFGNTTGVLHDWFWNISEIFTDNTQTDNITIYELDIDDCSTYGDLILNFSLNNEETNLPINESAGANVEVDLTLTSKTNSSIYLTYSNTWVNENNPQVCLPNNVLNNSEYWLDLTVGFDSTDHVWEFYYIDDGTLNSTKIIQNFNGDVTSNINLMDLLTIDSTSFLFNYFDQDGLAVVDAIVHPMRKYIGDGEFLEIERSKADQNGDTIVHLVEEDVIYFFYITQYGVLLHTSSTYTALCQATPCTIQIEASGDGATFDTDWDLIDGGSYTITDDASSRTVNLTYLVDTSKTFNLTVYKYNNDGSYSALNTTSSTGLTDTLLMTVPQSAGNVSFFVSVIVDDEFVNSEWVDFEQKSSDFFGTTLALFLGALIILTLGLMAVTEGVGTLVMVILGVAITGFLGLITTALSTGVNVVVYLVLAGGILLWKLTRRRN